MVRAYSAMLPRLQAEEQLSAVRTGALGNVQYEREDRARIVAALECQAGGERRPAPAPSPMMLAAMGIAVEELPDA